MLTHVYVEKKKKMVMIALWREPASEKLKTI